MISDTVRRNLIFLIACMLFLLSQFYRASVAVITPDLIRDLAIDIHGLSLISAGFYYSFSLMQIPISIYLDRIGPSVAMSLLTLIAVIGSILFALCGSLSILVAGRMLIGIGMACNLMGTLKLITLWYPPQRFGILSTWVISIGTIGNLVAATPLLLMVRAMGWRYSFLIIAGINPTTIFYDCSIDKILLSFRKQKKRKEAEMLPDCRVSDDSYSIPQFDIAVDDFDDILDELKGFHEQFHGCFPRTEPRKNFLNYMAGQLSPLERKSIEPIALNIENAKVRAMQFFVSDVRWDEEKILLQTSLKEG